MEVHRDDRPPFSQDEESDQFAPKQRYEQYQPQQGQAHPTQPPHRPAQFEQTGRHPPPGSAGFDPYDPMLDADPFGLSASMHFPTSYSYDQGAQR